MKTRKILILFLLALEIISCSPIFNEVSSPDTQKNTPFPEFILGKWYGRFPGEGGEQADFIEYQLEFTEPSTLYFHRISPSPSEGDNLIFEYRFIEYNKIELRGRLLDTWKLSKDDNGYLIIETLNGTLPDGLYKRMPTKNEMPISTYLLSLVFVLLTLFWIYRRSRVVSTKPTTRA